MLKRVMWVPFTFELLIPLRYLTVPKIASRWKEKPENCGEIKTAAYTVNEACNVFLMTIYQTREAGRQYVRPHLLYHRSV